MNSTAIVGYIQNSHCEVGVDRHFTDIEWKEICSDSWDRIEHLTEIQLNKFTDLTYYKSLNIYERRYVNFLLLYQRVIWSLDDALSFRFFSLPLEKIYNFKWMEDKIEQHYESFFKLDIKNEFKKKQFKIDIMTIVFRIWAAGYGVIKSEGRNVTAKPYCPPIDGVCCPKPDGQA
ncbi:hypothetical protein, partial [Paenibacillus alginolyticus]